MKNKLKRLKTLITGKKFGELTKEEQTKFLDNMQVKQPLHRDLMKLSMLSAIVLCFATIFLYLLVITAGLVNSGEELLGMIIGTTKIAMFSANLSVYSLSASAILWGIKELFGIIKYN